MPTRAMHRCYAPGCGIASPGRYCPAHVREKSSPARIYDKHRGSAHARGYSSRGLWMKLRGLVIGRDPICMIVHRLIADGHVSRGSAEHEQLEELCTQVSTLADHVVPKAAGGDDAMDNLQGGCAPCHGWKTRRVDPKLIRGASTTK